MAMEFLSFHDQLIAGLSADEEQQNLVFMNIIQDTKVARAQLKFGKQIRPQLLDCLGWRRR
jgi:hypothetical protein